ncbi:hypothetical protein ON058_01950 [Demequina sp. B12]|uniref:hypothetical protein n=1 Tax=Demequina sp. B12 TaxID=2992757 RepID=UPI00237BB6BA|nr:hypothetical protein [Demequina sp. B12]MDE0572174.1 hypothetical protein [Demequina sp. B12]
MLEDKQGTKVGPAGPAPLERLLAATAHDGIARHESVAEEPNKVRLWDISEHTPAK